MQRIEQRKFADDQFREDSGTREIACSVAVVRRVSTDCWDKQESLWIKDTESSILGYSLTAEICPKPREAKSIQERERFQRHFESSDVFKNWLHVTQGKMKN